MNCRQPLSDQQATDLAQLDDYVKQRYRDSLNYYWCSSIYNKRAYKIGRILTVMLGALVTLVASLSSSSLLNSSPVWQGVLTFATPVMAALLTIVAGFSQAFQWGSGWQNMVLAAQRLQGEYDRFIATPESERDHRAELELLNDFVVGESETFFERMLGGGRQVIEQLARDERSRGSNYSRPEL